MNKKELRVKKLWERGVTDPRILAKKLGYSGSAMDVGIERVNDALKRLGLKT